MYQYKIYGVNVEADIEMPSALETVSESAPQIKINKADLNIEYQEAILYRKKQEQCGLDDEGPWMTQKLSKSVSVMWIYSIGIFRITDGRLIEYDKLVVSDLYQIEQWILNCVFTIAMMQREQFIFHGSGLLYQNRMILISGGSGSGKSTLTDALLQDEMFHFMADDSVCFEKHGDIVTGIGAYPLRRLCEDVSEDALGKYPKESIVKVADGDKEKYCISMKDAYLDIPQQVQAVVILEKAAIKEPEMKCITGAQKLPALIECIYKKNSYKTIGFSDEMLKKCLFFCEKVDIFVIRRPAEGMTVAQLKKMVYSIVSESGKEKE